MTREDRVVNLKYNATRMEKSTHPGVIAAGVTASLCSAIFDLADAFNNIADALRGPETSTTMRMAEESVKRHQAQVSSDMRPMRGER